MACQVTERHAALKLLFKTYMIHKTHSCCQWKKQLTWWCDVSNKQLLLPRPVSVVYMQNKGPFFFPFFLFFAKQVCHQEISTSDGMGFSGAAAGFKRVTQSAPLYQHLQSAAQLETLSTFYPSLSRQKRRNTLFSQSGVEYDTQCISALIGVDLTPF